MTPETDIVIGVRNSQTVLPQCLDTLSCFTKNFRVIFVTDDTNSEDHRIVDEFCVGHKSSLKVVTYKQRWFTRAFNLGLRMVRTPWAVALNSDTVLGEGWLDELYAVRDAYRDEAQSATTVGLIGSVLSEEEPRRYFETQCPGYVTGHCWLLNMKALDECSLVSGTPGIYLDEQKAENIHIRSDVDLCHRMNKLGYATLQSHKSAVGHKFGHSWGLNLGAIPSSVDVVNDKWNGE